MSTQFFAARRFLLGWTASGGEGALISDRPEAQVRAHLRDARDSSSSFSAVFACTGNRFRSPLAAALVRRLVEGLRVTTESFGTLELEGLPALPEAIALADELGVDLGSHRARPLTRASLSDVDLMLGFEDAHVRGAVVDARAPRERSFTLRHFLRLLDELRDSDEHEPVARARTAIARANELRASVPSTPADDMRDPLGAPPKVQREIAAEIREQSLELASALFGVRDASLPPLEPPPKRSRLARLRFR